MLYNSIPLCNDGSAVTVHNQPTSYVKFFSLLETCL